MHHAKEILAHISASGWLGTVLAVVVVGGIASGYYASARLTMLSNDVSALRTELASTTALLQGSIAETHTFLSSALETEREAIQERLGGFAEDVEDISDTVGTLEKLSRTDPELLQKYSKVFFLNEHYAPERVVEIPKEYSYDEARTYQIHAGVWPDLKRLLDRAKRDRIELYVFSGYRPFDEQGVLKGQYTVTYGAGTANQFSADQGYSEHQLGTTVDFITTGIGGALTGFEKTAAYEWLQKNAYRYGFVLSYPEGNNYYVFEPWHWRFVGQDLAEELRDNDQHFYDLDQREIDKYLVSIFD